jgi:hypothetical protein
MTPAKGMRYKRRNRTKLAERQRSYYAEPKVKARVQRFFRNRYKRDYEELNERYLRQVFPWLREADYPADVLELCRHITLLKRIRKNANRPSA